MASLKFCQTNVYMDVVRLINKALSDEDIQKILGGDAKIIKYAELGQLYDIDQLLPNEKDYCIILLRGPTKQRTLDGPPEVQRSL